MNCEDRIGMFGSTNWSSFFTKLAHSWSLGIAMGPTRSSSIALKAASAKSKRSVKF